MDAQVIIVGEGHAATNGLYPPVNQHNIKTRDAVLALTLRSVAAKLRAFGTSRRLRKNVRGEKLAFVSLHPAVEPSELTYFSQWAVNESGKRQNK